MALGEYKKKRNFKATPEPKGVVASKKPKGDKLVFVVQLHRATRLHYDLRLEVNYTMKSWAVPKGPSLDPMERRLAVEVEDHPMDYNDFEGVIPPGNYGAGIVMIWDEGTYYPRSRDFAKKGSTPSKKAETAEIQKGYEKGHITFVLEGKKLKGEFALVKLKNQDGKNWLLLKKRDSHSSPRDVTLLDRSVRTGRNLTEIDERRSDLKGEPSQAKPPARLPFKIQSGIAKILEDYRDVLVQEELQTISVPTPWVVHKGVPAERLRADWLVQPVFSGYFASVAAYADGQCFLTGKNQIRFDKKFPGLYREIVKFAKLSGPLLLGGYIVPVDSKGDPRPLGHNLGAKMPRYHFYIYDILHFKGYQLESLPLKARLTILEKIPLESPCLVKILATQGHLFRFAPGTKYLLHSGGAHPKESSKLEEGTQSDVSVKHKFALTNQNRIYWPKEGITKGALIAYYRTVAPFMLPHLHNRPQSLNRFPEGIEGKSFFQKEVTGHIPGWIQTVTLPSGQSGKTVTYALVNKLEDLIFLVNMGCIEINMGLSQMERINEPDYVVFDLDPGHVSFSDVVLTAHAIKHVLDQLRAPAYLKTSGGRGLHIYVPISAGHSFDDIRKFAEKVSHQVHRQLPKITSLERSPAKRQNQVYLDFLQNRKGQTMVSVYSVRPRPGALVSTPLHWEELTSSLDVSQFHMGTVPERLVRYGDLWKDMIPLFGAKGRPPVHRTQRNSGHGTRI